ncbi:MAG: C4-type zinc ribbon domain-containing protein [Desulfatiglandaceae bacterium]
MQEQLSRLIDLQAFDKHLMAIANEKRQYPAKLKALDQKITEMHTEVKNAEIELEALKKEHRNMDQEIATIDAKIQKSNDKLSQIKSNKEYQAALKEIDDFQTEKQRREDRSIELMERIEDSERNQAEKISESKELTKAVEKERAQLKKHEQKLEKTFKSFLSQRKALCSDIDDSLLKHYEQLLKRKGGLAVSAVMKGVCQCCHLAIPPQKFNELIKGEKMMSCPHCMRIIYWGDDERYKSIDTEQDAQQG